MACKESHEVMRKYWFNDSFYKENPEYVDEDLNGGLRKWFYGNEDGVDETCNGCARERELYEP